ncbi:hypothetical protein Y032_0003g1354 [Ancylostoma ceylanicum]|uniref:BTB domain-containing protein n=1 Tax=Ancylostoma ceylanicum TaxID=53326 RepID=A0A016VWQ9_9BILA|nr:hypothetical protein Y032_0003g1354 [Ancylostoma ceylanicum]
MDAAVVNALPELEFAQGTDHSFEIRSEENHSSQVLASLRQQLVGRQFCDVDLLVDDRKISAHKVVLAACCPYFKDLLTGDETKAKHNQIVITGLDHISLEKLVFYMYGQSLTISVRNVKPIMVTAHFLQLHKIAEICATFVSGHLVDQANALAVRRFLFTLGYRSAATKVERFIEKHFVPITQTEGFLELSFEEVSELLSKDWLHVESEEQVFNAAMRWIEHSAERSDMVDRILSCVRLHLLDKSFFMSEVFRNRIIRNHRNFCNVVEKALEHHLISARLSVSRSALSKPRCSPYFPILVIGGYREEICLSDVENYDSRFEQWKRVQSLRDPRSYFGIAVDGEMVYVAGGRDDCYNFLNSVECYDVTRNEWTEVARMREKRFAPVAAFLKKKLYVCGGFYDRPLKTVEVYDPKMDSWEDGIPMTVARRGACVAVLNGYIYVMGGSDGSSRPTSSVERFSPKKGRWETMPPMSKSRFGAGAAVMNGMIYVCGGFNSEECYLRDVERFNPETMEWSSVAAMPAKRETAAVLSFENSIYVIGGFDGSDRCGHILMFNPETNSWNLGATLSYPRSCPGAAVISSIRPRRKIIPSPRKRKMETEERVGTGNKGAIMALVLHHEARKIPCSDSE